MTHLNGLIITVRELLFINIDFRDHSLGNKYVTEMQQTVKARGASRKLGCWLNWSLIVL